MNSSLWKIFTTFVLFLAATHVRPSSSVTIGVNYGTNGDNLPAPADVINLFKKCQIQQVRLFEPKTDILDALRQSNIWVSLGVRNEDLQNLAVFNDTKACTDWLNANVVPYKNDIKFTYITMGNEVVPGPLAKYLPNALNNMDTALKNLGLGDAKVTTVVPTSVLATSYPPSAGAFSADVIPTMGAIISFLSGKGIPLMVNVYPYFSYASDPAHVSLEYATFVSKDPVVDGTLSYYNLFDATVDAFNAAIEKVQAGDVTLTISETGWPSAENDPYASIQNAQVYNSNLLNHVTKNGTPRKPQVQMDTFIFAMFNENLKAAGVEQNFGLFYPNMNPVYPLFQC